MRIHSIQTTAPHSILDHSSDPDFTLYYIVVSTASAGGNRFKHPRVYRLISCQGHILERLQTEWETYWQYVGLERAEAMIPGLYIHAKTEILDGRYEEGQRSAAAQAIFRLTEKAKRFAAEYPTAYQPR